MNEREARDTSNQKNEERHHVERVCVCVCVCVREKERERERERERELDVPGTQHVARSSTVQQQRYHIMLSEALPGLRELCCVCVVCV